MQSNTIKEMLFEHNKPWKYVIKVEKEKLVLFYVETKQNRKKHD